MLRRCLYLSLLASTAVGQEPVRDAAAERRASRSLAAMWTRAHGTAVDHGLAWLAKTQDKRGFWYAQTGKKGRDWDYDNYRIERTVEDLKARGSGHIGVSALAGMAFLSGGHLPGRGKYGALVQRTLDYILAHVGEDGLITDSGTRMYSHALATLFLAEVYGMKREKRIKIGLENAIHIIVDGQNAEGGWRYYLFSKDSDLSITVCQLQALRAAKNIGIEVPRSAIDRAVEYVRNCRVPPGGPTAGLYFYKIPKGRFRRGRKRKDDHFAINSAAVTSFVSAGIYDRELLGRPVDFLVERLPAEIREFGEHYQFWYGNYYACQALFHADRMVRDGVFAKYYTTVSRHLLDVQQGDGRWVNDVGPGDAFSTAVACIVLQVPMQYLPIFQR